MIKSQKKKLFKLQTVTHSSYLKLLALLNITEWTEYANLAHIIRYNEEDMNGDGVIRARVLYEDVKSDGVIRARVLYEDMNGDSVIGARVLDEEINGIQMKVKQRFINCFIYYEAVNFNS